MRTSATTGLPPRRATRPTGVIAQQLITQYEIDHVETDVVKDTSWYREKAEKGFARTQYNLGICLQNGIGCEKDQEEAVFWYRKAAEQGHARARCQLGYCLQLGIGCEKNEKEAVSWYREAADQENDLAQNNLGFCLENGIGGAKNISESTLWYCKAALNKNISAKETLTSKLQGGFKLEQSKQNTPLNTEEIIEVVEGLSLCNRVSLGESDIIENLVQLSLSKKTITTKSELEEILTALLARNSEVDLTKSKACSAIHNFIRHLDLPVTPSQTNSRGGKTPQRRGGADHLDSSTTHREVAALDLDEAPHGTVTKPQAKSSSTSTDDEHSL